MLELDFLLAIVGLVNAYCILHIAIVGLDFLVDFVYCILIFKLLSLFE